MLRKFVALGLFSTVSVASAVTVDFEDLSLPAGSYHNNGSFVSRGASFANAYDSDYGSWEGFAYSNTSDTVTPGWINQYSAITGAGVGGSGIYGVGYTGGWTTPSRVTLPAGASPASVMITNTTYAYYTVRDGDSFGFSKKFGGVSGNDPDFFRLTITGYDAGNSSVGAVQMYLADYRFADNAQDYILNTWQQVDLSSLAGSRSLVFTLDSTDNGTYGMNTPAYFAMDNLVLAPEPGSLGVLLAAAGLVLRRRNRC